MAGTAVAGRDESARTSGGFWWRWVGANALAEAIGLGDTLLLTTQRSRAWWRNLTGGASVTLWLRGREYRATAEAQIDAAATAADLLAISRQVPAMQRHVGVTLDAAGEPTDRTPLAEAAARMITIRVTGLEPVTEEAGAWRAQQ